MKNDVYVQQDIVIPEHEIEITTSRSGGPGGQHVNKTSTRITVRWNVQHTSALNDEQKERVLRNLHARLTSDGDLIIHNSASRSQLENKKMALANLAQAVRQALHVPKKRTATRVSRSVKAARLNTKTHRGAVKKMRSKKIQED